jgi:hypothetical protein
MFGKEAVAGAHRGLNWVPHYGSQADLGRAQDAQALLRLCSGSAQACSPSAQACSPSTQVCSPLAQVCSPSAQVKAAVAHVQRLKRNQRKGKLILSLWVSIHLKLRIWVPLQHPPWVTPELPTPKSASAFTIVVDENR